MPTVLFIRGWRLFFYANERNEPPHIHARKGEVEFKFWLYPEAFEIEEVRAYNANARDRRDIRELIFAHFDYLASEYEAFHERLR